MSRPTLTLTVHSSDAPAYSRRFAGEVVKLGRRPSSGRRRHRDPDGPGA